MNKLLLTAIVAVLPFAVSGCETDGNRYHSRQEYRIIESRPLFQRHPGVIQQRGWYQGRDRGDAFRGTHERGYGNRDWGRDRGRDRWDERERQRGR